MKWVEKKLKDFVDINMGQSPPSKFYNEKKEGMPFLQGNRTFGEKYIQFDTYTTSITKIGDIGDVIMSVRAPVGDLNISTQPFCLGRGVCSLRMKNGSNEFLYYLMKANIGRLIKKEGGTVFGSISKKDIEDFSVKTVTNTDDQFKITSILTNLDEKIRHNNILNKNLEQIIMSIFKEWFVKFAPFKQDPFINSVLGFIPHNWNIGQIEDYCSLKSGFAFKSSWWEESGVKVIKIKDISQGHINLDECSCVSKDKLIHAKEFKVIQGDLLIAMTGATLGKFSIVPRHDKALYINQRVGKFFLGDKPIHKLPFLWCLLNQKRIFNEIINRGQGSAQANISPADIGTILIILPPEDIITKFNKKMYSFFKIMINNSYETEKLNNLRDILLPKLMSGEIDVSDMEI